MEATNQDLQPRAAESDCVSSKTDFTQSSWITSRWRWPSDPEILPEYIHVQFRVKAFSVLAIRHGIMLGIMTLVHWAVLHSSGTDRGDLHLACSLVGLLTVCSMILLYTVRKEYPLNYSVLVLGTLLAGIWWGLVGITFSTLLVPRGAGTTHFELIGCVCGTGFVAAALAMLLPCAGRCRCHCVAAAPLLLGWAVSAATEVVVAVHLGTPLLSALTAALLALLFIQSLLFNVGRVLKECDPDAFVRVALAMDVTLFVIAALSLPLLGPVVCCLCIATTSAGPDLPQGVPDPPRGVAEDNF